MIIGQRENVFCQLLLCGQSIGVTCQDIQEQYHIILNINKMSQPYYSPEYISEIRMNIIDRLYQYSRTGATTFLQDTGDPNLREKYNTIITKFESLKENKYAEAVERMVSHITWKQEYQSEIKAIFTTKRAQSIIHQLKGNLKNTVAINKIIQIAKTYNQSQRTYRALTEENIPDEIDSIIKKISLLRQALRVTAEYPSVVNCKKLNDLVKQRSKQFGPFQTSDLNHIYLLKDCIRSVEEKLRKFHRHNSRTYDEYLTDRIRDPLQKLLVQHQHALQSLDQIKQNPTHSVKAINEETMQTQMRDQISNLSRKVQEILRRCNVPFECLQGSDIQRLSANIDSLGSLLQKYNDFADKFQQISLKNNIPYATSANNYQIFPSQQSISTNRLDKMIECLRRSQQAKTNEVKPQHGYKAPILRFNYGVRNLNNIHQETTSKTKDLQERTVLLNRWQTIWRKMGFQNTSEISLDRNQYPKKGQKDEPLQAILSQIETLQKCHQEYIDNSKGLRLLTQDEQFLACNPNIKQEFYKDKNTIHNMTLNEIQFRNIISSQKSQLQALKCSLKQITMLLDRVQAKLDTIIQVEHPNITNTRQGRLLGRLNYLQQIVNYKSERIIQIQGNNSRLKQQILGLQTQITQLTAQKNIAELQTKNKMAQYKRKQEENAQKAANELSKVRQSRQILMTQKESLYQDYRKKIQDLEKAKKQIAARDEKIKQLQIKIQSLQKDLQQANRQLDFSNVYKFEEQEKISLQQFKQISQKLERQTRQLQKIREDRSNDQKMIQDLKQEISDSKRNCQQLQNSLKASKKDAQKAKSFKQAIIERQNEILRLNKKIDDLNAEIKKQKSVIKSLKDELQTAQNEKHNIQVEKSSLEMQLSMMSESTIQPCKINHEEIEHQQKRLDTQIRDLTEQLDRKSKDIYQLSSKLTQSQIEIMRQEGEAQTYKSELKKKNEMIQKLKVTSSANVNPHVRNPPNKKIDQAEIRQNIFKELSIKYQSQFVARKKRLMKIYATKYSNAAQQSNLGELREIYLACIDNFFQGELLNQHIDYKYRLAYHLETFAGVPILRTKLIYTFDLKNKTNFHLYIDGVTSLLFIVKTVTGLFLAGYYSGKYLQGPMMGPGLLISISNNDSFRLNVPDHNSKNSYRCMVYDPYFLIFGNAQIRIKTGQKELFSNFGIMNSYFNTSNKKLKDFIGFEDKRQVEIESYEMYEVLFNYEFYDD